MINLHERMLSDPVGSNPRSPDHQSDAHPIEPHIKAMLGKGTKIRSREAIVKMIFVSVLNRDLLIKEIITPKKAHYFLLE